MRTVTSPTLLDDLSQLDALFATEGWQTLLTFAKEVAREYILTVPSLIFPNHFRSCHRNSSSSSDNLRPTFFE